jgi:hypothetical protein
MQDIFSALPALLAQNSDNEELRQAVVFAVWRRVAGESLTGHAAPVGLEGTKLTVAVADRNWQRNIAQLAGEMIFRLNSMCRSQQVKFIEFVIDKAALSAASPRSVDRAQLEDEALEQINEGLRSAADTISDDDLRRRFLLAAGSCLAREERMAAK